MSAQAGLFIDCRPLPEDSDGVLVTVSGPLLLRAAGDLRRVLNATLDGGTRHLLVDLGGVTDVDPGGLATLVVAARRLQVRRNGDLMRIVDISAECADVMRRLHLFTDEVDRLSRGAYFVSGRLLV